MTPAGLGLNVKVIGQSQGSTLWWSIDWQLW